MELIALILHLSLSLHVLCSVTLKFLKQKRKYLSPALAHGLVM